MNNTEVGTSSIMFGSEEVNDEKQSLIKKDPFEARNEKRKSKSREAIQQVIVLSILIHNGYGFKLLKPFKGAVKTLQTFGIKTIHKDGKEIDLFSEAQMKAIEKENQKPQKYEKPNEENKMNDNIQKYLRQNIKAYTSNTLINEAKKFVTITERKIRNVERTIQAIKILTIRMNNKEININTIEDVGSKIHSVISNKFKESKEILIEGRDKEIEEVYRLIEERNQIIPINTNNTNNTIKVKPQNELFTHDDNMILIKKQLVYGTFNKTTIQSDDHKEMIKYTPIRIIYTP